MVVPLKFSFWFNFYINSKTSVEFTADKMRNILTKQEPDDTYKTNLHELQKNCQLNYHMPMANMKTTFCK